MVVYARESPTFSVESYNWLSVNIVFVQIRIQSRKQYITCTLHYIVEYIQYTVHSHNIIEGLKINGPFSQSRSQICITHTVHISPSPHLFVLEVKVQYTTIQTKT